jgi:hypothetical protein
LKLRAELMTNSNDLMAGKGFIDPSNNQTPLAGKKISLAQYLGSYCASLDVCVSFAEGVSPPVRLHSKVPTNPSEYENWLRRMILADAFQSPDLDQYLKVHAGRLRPGALPF